MICQIMIIFAPKLKILIYSIRNNMLDKSKLKELDSSKVISVYWNNEWDDVTVYNFIFHDNKIFMDSSNNGEIYITDIDDIDIHNIYNWKTIERWYRRFGIEIICHILENDLQDVGIFYECYENDTKMFIELGERDENGNILEWIAESTFIISDYY